MGVLEKQIVTSKKAYEDRWRIHMTSSLLDAYNDILSKFSETKVDDGEYNQFLKNDKGDVYYFDNFKYVYPRVINDDSDVRALNSNRGKDQFCCVRYNGSSIVVEDYYEKGVAEITSYFMTDESRKLLEHMKGDLGNFLLQISGDSKSVIETLYLGSRITVKQEDEKLVSYDINGEVLDSVPTNAGWTYDYEQKKFIEGPSFYKELRSKVNYYGLLDRTYTLTQDAKSAENIGPTK